MSDYHRLPERFQRCEQTLLQRWHAKSVLTEPAAGLTEDYRSEVTKALGQCGHCLRRLIELERENSGPRRTDHDVRHGYDEEIFTEGFYYACHRFLKLCEKVEELGMTKLYDTLDGCDVSIVRNHFIEHVEKPKGVPGADFAWELPNGPVIKPFGLLEGLKTVGLYAHAAQVLEALEEFLDLPRQARGDDRCD